MVCQGDSAGGHIAGPFLCLLGRLRSSAFDFFHFVFQGILGDTGGSAADSLSWQKAIRGEKKTVVIGESVSRHLLTDGKIRKNIFGVL